MKKSKFTEAQIVFAIRQAETGEPLARRSQISNFDLLKDLGNIIVFVTEMYVT